ncbi:MAG TPA: hypothetical protein VM658_13795 [bacterium]|nr:hypothetical protein [bacterium]
MTQAKLVPIYRGPIADATLLKSFLESDGLAVTMAPDVTSEPLQSPGAHTIRSRYTDHVLLVSEQDVERAEELMKSYEAEEE